MLHLNFIDVQSVESQRVRHNLVTEQQQYQIKHHNFQKENPFLVYPSEQILSQND